VVDWLVWVAIALAAGVVEVVSLQLVLAMFAGGAVAAAAAAAVGAGPVAQVMTFAVASTVLLLGARPPLLRWSRRTAKAVTGVAALVGRRAEVLEEVTHAEGLVKLAGENWSARTDQAGQVLPAGMNAYVQRIDGATAILSAEPPAAAAEPSSPTESSR
jgi:membrane protein implicated in regulation of membrane protease activity